MRSWTEVLDMVRSDDTGKWDAVASAGELEMDEEDGCIRHSGNQAVEPSKTRPTDFALGQVCSRLEVPAKYVRRLPPSLRAQCINHDMRRMAAERKRFLLRCKGDAMRGFLSDKYSRIDNSEIVDTFNTLAKDFTHQVRDFHLDDRGIWMKILVNDLREWDPVHKSEKLEMGLLVGNSEVGCRSVTVEPFVYREACTNDMVVQLGASVKVFHIHIKPSELRLKVAQSMNTALKAGDKVMDKFVKSYEESVEKPVDVIEALAKKRGISQERTDSVKLAFEADAHENKFGVVNAFTRAAQALNGDDRVEMERFAGSLLDQDLSKVKLLEQEVAAQ